MTNQWKRRALDSENEHKQIVEKDKQHNTGSKREKELNDEVKKLRNEIARINRMYSNDLMQKQRALDLLNSAVFDKEILISNLQSKINEL